MTVTLTRTDDGYEAFDRFVVSRSYRRPLRGPSDRIASGWLVSDLEIEGAGPVRKGGEDVTDSPVPAGIRSPWVM